MHTSVEVDADADVLADGLAHRRDPGDDLLDLHVGVDVFHLLAGVHLQRREARRDLPCRCLPNLGRTVAADPRVHAHLVAHRAAQQLVHRNPIALALDIPKRHIDTGDGAHQHRTATIKAAAIQHLPDVLDLVRIASHQIRFEFQHARCHRPDAPFERCFAPSVDTLIRGDLQEQPAWRDHEYFHTCYFHRSCPSSNPDRCDSMMSPSIDSRRLYRSRATSMWRGQ